MENTYWDLVKRRQVDDWFTLLNLGYRFTALGNSDTHGTTKTESGCPRNYVYISGDDPLLVDIEISKQSLKNIVLSQLWTIRRVLRQWKSTTG